MTDRLVVGATLTALGTAAVLEGRRLYALRETMVAGAVVGDDTFPIVLGVVMIVLGVLVAVTPVAIPRVHLPTGAARSQMLWGGLLLVVYWTILPTVGYTVGTALVSIALFRAMGGYRWPAAMLAGAITTVTLHLLFRVWLRQPLPSGWFGI